MAGRKAPEGGLVAAATAALRERIASGQWPVGSRIPTEPELGELLGVGRSTVREAVRALTTLGMLEPLTARGTFVRSITPVSGLLAGTLSDYPADELLSVRRAIDVEAAQAAAAQRGDDDLARLEDELHQEAALLRGGGRSDAGAHCTRFHAAIVRASGNRLLGDLHRSLSAAMDAAGLVARIGEAVEVAVCLDEHDRILTAIRGRDVAAAAHRMALHVDAGMRGVQHEPIVTDLTSLVGLERADEPARRGIA